MVVGVCTMATVSIYMPEELLRELDRVARESQTTRSALVVQAALHFLEEKEEECKKE